MTTQVMLQHTSQPSTDTTTIHDNASDYQHTLPQQSPPPPQPSGMLGTDLLLMVGDDAADKVGVGVAQGGHQFAQLLLVQLPHCAEHALACP